MRGKLLRLAAGLTNPWEDAGVTKLLNALPLALIACTAAACSAAEDSTSGEPQFHNTSTTETSADNAESTEASPSPTAGKDKEGDSGLKEQAKEDFIATNLGHATSTVYGVSSPNDRVACTVTEDQGLIGCSVMFADPPLYPATGQPLWLSNSVNFDANAGFYPNVKMGGDAAAPTRLEAGNTVTMNGVTFESVSEDEFTVKIDGHHFTVKDDGEYYSDTFPPEPDGEGKAMTGTICGDLGNGEYVYAKENGTNCARAMEVLEYYNNYDFAPTEGGNRGYLMEDDFSCSYNADPGWPDEPDYRWLGCSIEDGGAVVVLDPTARALVSEKGGQR